MIETFFEKICECPIKWWALFQVLTKGHEDPTWRKYLNRQLGQKTKLFSFVQSVGTTGPCVPPLHWRKWSGPPRFAACFFYLTVLGNHSCTHKNVCAREASSVDPNIQGFITPSYGWMVSTVCMDHNSLTNLPFMNIYTVSSLLLMNNAVMNDLPFPYIILPVGVPGYL